MKVLRALLAASLTLCLGCSSTETTPPAAIAFTELGSLTSDDGRGSFRFGAASAAAQIEDKNIHIISWRTHTEVFGA